MGGLFAKKWSHPDNLWMERTTSAQKIGWGVLSLITFDLFKFKFEPIQANLN